MKITRGHIALREESVFVGPVFVIQIGNDKRLLNLSRPLDSNERDMDSYVIANILREMANELDDN